MTYDNIFVIIILVINMNKFIDDMIKENKVVNYEDVYLDIQEYGLTEEESEFYITRYKNQTKKYSVGDIVFIKEFEYKDGYKGKNHLFVIVKENECVPIEYFCMLISSNLNKLKYKDNIFLKKDNINNLDKNSIIKTDCLYKIKEEQISFYIGKISKNLLNKFKEGVNVYE